MGDQYFIALLLSVFSSRSYLAKLSKLDVGSPNKQK